MFVSSVFNTDQSLICVPSVWFHMATQNSKKVVYKIQMYNGVWEHCDIRLSSLFIDNLSMFERGRECVRVCTLRSLLQQGDVISCYVYAFSFLEFKIDVSADCMFSSVNYSR